MNALEHQLIADATLFDRVETPPAFRRELGQTLRQLPPPVAPTSSMLRPWFIGAIVTAAAAAAVIVFLGCIIGLEQPQNAVVGNGDPTPTGTQGGHSSLEPLLPQTPDSAVPVIAVIDLPGDLATKPVRSEFVDSTLEKEWNYIKADAKVLSGPFRSAMPSAIYQR